jgi:4'-phosphopantetheinyl transferase
MPGPDWRVPDRAPSLGEGEVHVWRASLAVCDAVHQPLEASLSAEERERAARFHFARDRRRFEIARGVLRDILSRCTGRPAADLRFVCAHDGKPELHDTALRFNVAHSRDLALYAVARARRVGVDVEAIAPERASLDIARRFFSPAEHAALAALAEEARAAAFFRCWTRKEAFLKALGSGLARPLGSFTVSVDPDDDPRPMEGVLVRRIEPGSGFAGAVAAYGDGWCLTCLEWMPGP